MKVMIRAYSCLNVGDDLYLHLLFKRYPDTSFYVMPPSDYYNSYKEHLACYKNAVVLEETYSVAYKIKRKLGILDIDSAALKQYDACIHIAGSIFMENPDNTRFDVRLQKEVAFFHQHRRPYFFLSCNFGPYLTEAYVKEKRSLFEMAADVCFRDTYSYKLFQSIPSVRYAPDAVFTYALPAIEKTPKTIGLSIIDLKNRKGLLQFQEEYTNTLTAALTHYINQGYQAYVFSFCKVEGDSIGAKDVIERLARNGMGSSVTLVEYTGDADAFLSQYAAMERMIASRFHSMILSVLLRQPLIPIVYSEKFTRVVQDLALCTHYYTIEQLHHLDWADESLFNCACKTQHLDTLTQKAQGIFQFTDSFLTGKVKTLQ